MRRLAALACWAALLCAAAPAARSQVLTLDRASVVVVVDGGPAVRAEASLPYNWDRMHAGRSGEAVFEMRFTVPAGVVRPYGLYLPRVGSAAQIYLNDALLLRDEGFDQPGWVDYSKGPRYLRLAPDRLQVDNRLRVHIRADGGRRGGLSQVTVGPQTEVHPLYAGNYRLRVTVSLMLAAISLFVGITALVLAAIQALGRRPGIPRHGALYLSAGVAELCWALRVGDVVIEHPPLAWPAWGVAMTAALAGWVCGVVLFCHAFAHPGGNRFTRWLRWGMAALFAASILASGMAFVSHRPNYLTAWLGAANVFAAGYTFVFLAGALRSRRPVQLLVAVVGVINVAMGAHDWVAVRISGDLAANTLVRYSALLFALVLAYAVIAQFRMVSAQASDLAEHLEERVADKERELQVSYRRLEALAREQERASERARILRDMHDGVGADLSTAIRQLQSGRASSDEVLLTLRDTLDQLKLSIDSMHLPPGDINALLASLRYRLEPRLKASDVTLEWQVDVLPAVDRLDSSAMRHLQFMAFEAISNVLQHAGATVLRLQARTEADSAAILVLRICDNGRGFDTRVAQGRGLRSMHERAAAIGVQVVLESGPAGSVVEYRIRLDAAQAAS